MNKKTLIYTDTISGHYLEYINNIYNYISISSNKEYIIVVLKDFELISNKLSWNNTNNIKIHYLNNKNIQKIKGGLILKSIKRCMLLKKTANLYDIEDIILINLMGFMPILPFVLNNKYKIKGIIYKIYLYRWSKSSIVTKVQDIIKFHLFAQFDLFNKVLILNDKLAASIFNKIYKTNKFHSIPDPIKTIDYDKVINLRHKLKINNTNKVMVHVGSMSDSKGTLELLDAISLYHKSNNELLTYIFAGKVNNDIKNKFYEKLEKTKINVQIYVYDEFCSFEFLGSVIYTSDVVVCPYKRTDQSSGIIGYAAQFKKPLIVTKGGLLGKLVKKYRLGILIEESSPNEILKGIRKFVSYDIYKYNQYNKTEEYLKDNTKNEFCKKIID